LAAFTVTIAVLAEPSEPVRVTALSVETAKVDTGMLAEVWPARTVTEVADPKPAAVEALVESVTTSPLGPAGALSVTVREVADPPSKLVTGVLTAERMAESTVSLAVLGPTLQLVVITTVVLALTGLGVIVNVAVVCPADKVTCEGTDAAAALELPMLMTYPAGANPVSVTVPVTVFPGVA
jgi:hypothetical protein